MADGEKRIEVVELPVRDLKTAFGNPRKIRKKGREELENSLDTFGDFGLIVIDEENNIIAGNQRVSVLKDKDENTVVLCKRLVGYSEAELKAINIKDNTHSGEWDVNMLAAWQADLMVDLGFKPQEKDAQKRKVRMMEPIRYEKYDYVMIVCRNEVDYANLIRSLGLENGKILIANKSKLHARAVWYDDMKAQIVPKEEAKPKKPEGWE